jgi:hypothetical protein
MHVCIQIYIYKCVCTRVVNAHVYVSCTRSAYTWFYISSRLTLLMLTFLLLRLARLTCWTFGWPLKPLFCRYRHMQQCDVRLLLLCSAACFRCSRHAHLSVLPCSHSLVCHPQSCSLICTLSLSRVWFTLTWSLTHHLRSNILRWLCSRLLCSLTNQTEMETKALELAGQYFDPDSDHYLIFTVLNAARAERGMRRCSHAHARIQALTHSLSLVSLSGSLPLT